MNRWEGIKPSCVQDLHQFMLWFGALFSMRVLHTPTLLQSNIYFFIQRQKVVKIKRTLLVRKPKSQKII
jgi:hypothetical protein